MVTEQKDVKNSHFERSFKVLYSSSCLLRREWSTGSGTGLRLWRSMINYIVIPIGILCYFG